MTDERIAELMGWAPDLKICPGDMAYRVRALVVTAERDEREACAKVCDRLAVGPMDLAQWTTAIEGARLIRERSNSK